MRRFQNKGILTHPGNKSVLTHSQDLACEDAIPTCVKPHGEEVTVNKSYFKGKESGMHRGQKTGKAY